MIVSRTGFYYFICKYRTLPSKQFLVFDRSVRVFSCDLSLHVLSFPISSTFEPFIRSVCISASNFSVAWCLENVFSRLGEMCGRRI